MFERSRLKEDLGLNTSVLEIALLSGPWVCIDASDLDISEFDFVFQEAVLGLVELNSISARLFCEAVFGLLMGMSEYSK